MSRVLAGVLVGGAIAVGGWVGPAHALPAIPLAAETPLPFVQKVHGGHRACVWRRWWHRHVGPYHRPVSCDRVYGGGYYGGPSIYLRLGDRDRDRDRRFRRGDRDDDRRRRGRD